MQDHHVIAIYYHSKAYNGSNDILVHFEETELDAHQWVFSHYFKGRIDDISEQFEFIEQHITFVERSVSECLNILLESESLNTLLKATRRQK